MLESLFDQPVAIVAIAINVLLALLALIGLVFVRRCVLPRLRVELEDAAFSGTMVNSVMVFYGLAVALIAVSVWQDHSDAAHTVSLEASELAALFEDVSAYPEPTRSALRAALREYVEYVIHEAWPLQKQGKVPSGAAQMKKFQLVLTAFEPVTESQKILHAEALRAFNETIEAREQRLDAAGASLPAVLWVVVLAGAAISLCTSFFFKVHDARLHGILVALLASFIGLLIFMIFALERPFRGELGLRADPYQLIYDQLMKD